MKHVICSENDNTSDFTIQSFKKPLVYKDLLLSAVFKDSLLLDKNQGSFFIPLSL